MDDRRKKIIAAIAINAADQFMKLYDEASDSDSDNELNLNVIVAQGKIRRRGERNPLEKPTRNENYYEITIPRYTDTQFREHFRLTRHTFQNLELRLGPSLIGNVDGRPRVEVRRQLLSVLWILATPDSFRYVTFYF